MIQKIELDASRKELIEDMTQCFGYKITETTTRRHGRAHRSYVVISRDTEMKHYAEIQKYENIYETNRTSIEAKKEIDGWIAFALFLLLIFPGAIYLGIKIKINNQIEERNNDRKYNMELAKKKAKELLNE